MKNLHYLFIILSVFFIGFLQAGENFITVYNENLALVKQVRTVEINKNELPLRFTDVAAQIIPTSVHLQSLSGDEDFRILEQNFEYDVVSAEKILEKYIDHSVEIVSENGELTSGILLSKSGGSLVLKTDAGIKILPWNNKMTVNVKELPEGLITRPTLIWELANVVEGKEKLEVSYLTNGMKWHAEYVGVLNEDASQVNLESWVSIDNKSGTTFKNSQLKLVAGEIHRAPPERPSLRRQRGVEAMALADREPGFEEREFFEYHIYELGRKTTLKNNQIKQIALFAPADVQSQKKFYYNGRRNSKKVEVRLLFKNEEEAGLGRPLPAGVFRIYQKDKESLEFIGEDRIDHTPRNEQVKITLGNAFDLVGERKVVDRQKISKRSERQTVEIELRNNKPDDDVTIVVEESLYWPNWKISNNNFSYRKVDARHIEFDIPVKADGKTTLRYTVTYSW